MKKLVFIVIGVLFISSRSSYFPEIEKYIEFLKQDHKSAKDYILDLWQKNDIVILCERAHPENTQYQLILDIIKDKRFIKNIGNVFTEVGTVSMQDRVNDFVHKNYANDSLRAYDAFEIHRNIEQGDRPIWMMYNFYYLITELNKINSVLPKKDKINLFVSDIPFQGWQNVSTREDCNKYAEYIVKNNRDSTIALNVINKLDKLNTESKKKTKCLIILNYRHAFKNNYVGNYNYKVYNAAKIIFDQYPSITANVYLNYFAEKPSNKTGNEEIDSLYVPLQNGKWDAAFKSLSIQNLGFDFKDSPFGKDNFDYIPVPNSFTYKDMFTGFAYYLPFEEHSCIWGVPGIVTSEFKNEYFRRCRLLSPNKDSLSIEKELEYL
ncbi:MAG: hypothetical protein EPN88_05830 [Bacteroidetes bacterium]|nr:MAG: hypothetical protein EPN88_05830 [Bacteroidota bacterium]